VLHQAQKPNPRDLFESVRAFRRHSAFPVYSVNTLYGAPEGLDRLKFDAIVLHYSMFYDEFRPVGERVRALLERSKDTFKIAIFQDEQAYLSERLDFVRRYAVDCVFTCLEAPYSAQIYGPAGPSRIVTYLPGYVSDWLVATGAKLQRPDRDRPIDIGYRGRRPPSSWGGAAQEKYDIAVRFREHAMNSGLTLDIETDEHRRIYGRRWPRFIAGCKAMLGTESGAEITDPVSGTLVPYRTISPRHFEAAALRSVQILYDGHYSGALVPMVHYIPLRKDFSNFDEVIAAFRDPSVRQRLADSAETDLIASGRYGYSAFVAMLDGELHEAGLRPSADDGAVSGARSTLYPGAAVRRLRRWRRAPRISARIARIRAREIAARVRAQVRSG
jgi:hypothetical protein